MPVKLITVLALIAASLVGVSCADGEGSPATEKHLPGFRASIVGLKSRPTDPVIEDGTAVKAAPSNPSRGNREQLSVYCYSSGVDSAGIVQSHGPVLSRAELGAQWVNDALAHSASSGEYVVIIDKSAYQLHLVHNGEPVSSYFIELGANPVDDKRMEGDMRTPEGVYYASDKRDVGETMYYRGFLLDYPNDMDRREFRELKRTGQVPVDATIGGGIMLHGLGSGMSPEAGGENWTHGCIALSDEDMDAVFPYIDAGTRVVIAFKTELSQL